MRFLEVFAGFSGLAALVALAAIVWQAAEWKRGMEYQLTAIHEQVEQQSSNNNARSKGIAELRAEIAELKSAKGDRIIAGSSPSAEEIAAVIVRDHAEDLRGPRGEKGEPGPVGPQGVPGNGNSVSPSKAMTVIDFSQVSSGIRVGGIEWGTPTCTRISSKVTCEALIKNDSGEDFSSYYVYMSKNTGSTRAFTDALTQNAIGGLTSKSWSKKYDGRVSFKFPAGIVYPLKWDVFDVPKEANGFTRMDINVSGGHVKYENVPIRN
jgi:hypothetical protein